MTDIKVLYGFCDACGERMPARQLTAVCVQPKQSVDPKWLLVCGACYVDGPRSASEESA